MILNAQPQKSQHGNVDAKSLLSIEGWLAQLHEAVCTKVDVRFAGCWLTLRAEALKTDVDVTTMETSYTVYHDDATPLLAHDNTQDGDPHEDEFDADRRASAVLQPLVGARIRGTAVDAATLALSVTFDTGYRLVVQPTARDELQSGSYWMVIFHSGVSLDVGPERYYALEVEGDPLPPPPYRPDKLVEGARLAGPDRGGRLAFAHEAHTDADLAPVRAVLHDLLGQPCVRAEVSSSRMIGLHFGQARHRTLRGRATISGDWHLTASEYAPVTLSGADGTVLHEGIFASSDTPLLQALAGARVTHTDVRLPDLGFTFVFDNGMTLVLDPPAKLHTSPDPYESFWRLSGPDRPQRVLDVGPGRYVSYLLVPGRW